MVIFYFIVEQNRSEKISIILDIWESFENVVCLINVEATNLLHSEQPGGCVSDLVKIINLNIFHAN